MSSVDISRVGSLPQCTLGEGPFWDQESQSLIYVDIIECRLGRYFPATKRNQTLKLEPTSSGQNVTFVIPVEGEPELFLLSVGRDVGLVRWTTADPDQKTAKLCSLVTVDDDEPRNRFNDGKCDHKGQLWAGTMGFESKPGLTDPEKGKVYCFSSSMKAEAKVDKINLSNGLAWNSELTQFYYIDTGAYSVDAFDYDRNTDAITNRRKLVDYKSAGLPNDFPDGMAIDTDDKVWVANYNGAKIICVDGRKGGILRTVDLPIQNPTSVCWGGPNYDELFVTSSVLGLSKEHMEREPDNGGIFLIKGLGAKGAPPNKVKLDQALVDLMK